MKILAINATDNAQSYSLPIVPRPYSRTFYGHGYDPNHVELTRTILRNIPKIDLVFSYTEALKILQKVNSFDLIITSFTPHDLLSVQDLINEAYLKSIARSKNKFRERSYDSAYFYLSELKKYAKTNKFIIYTKIEEPNIIVKDFLSIKKIDFEWIPKTTDEIHDQQNLKNSVFDLLSEYSLSISENGEYNLTQALSRSAVNIEDSNLDISLIAKPHFQTSRLIEDLEEFTFLINQKNISEEKIHNFLLAHPKFLLGNRYKSIRSKVQLKRDDQGPLIPDFILEPVSNYDFWKIVDLKLPDVGITSSPLNREGFNSQIMKAINQLSKYRSYFDNPKYRKSLSNIGISAYKPTLSVIIGRDYGKLNSTQVIESKEPLNAFNFEVVTFNELIEQSKQYFNL